MDIKKLPTGKPTGRKYIFSIFYCYFAGYLSLTVHLPETEFETAAEFLSVIQVPALQ